MAAHSSEQSKPSMPGLARPPLRDLLNLPNTLTLVRLFLIPVFVGLTTRHQYGEALWVFVVAAVTDALDGAVARWFKAKTELGAFLDPFADKLLLVSAFVVLTFTGDFPSWALGVVVIRDVVIVFGYFSLAFFASERIAIRPSYLGKVSTVFQLAAVIAVLARIDSTMPAQFRALLWAMVAITAVSGIHYVYRGLVWLFYREPEMFE
jgi:cardiolipin synthase (CMP-forming)